MKSPNPHLPFKKPNPLLIGILIDVSSSMQRNWQNRDGRKLPRIELIQDALNNRLRKLALIPKQNKTRRTVDLFCIGMGFRRPMYLSDVDIKYGYEQKLDTEKIKKAHTGIVCDLLALSEIVPSKENLEKLDVAINNKWNMYAQELLSQVKTDDDIYDLLQDYIQSALYKSGDNRLRTCFLYKSYLRLEKNQVVNSHRFFKNIMVKWLAQIEARKKDLEILPARTSIRYFDSIMQCTEDLFQNRRNDYEQFIKETLEYFVSTQVEKLIYLLTIGYPFEKLLAQFDDEKVKELATKIYQYLKDEVEKNIRVMYATNIKNLIGTTRKLRASLDYKRVHELTEQCIQKYSWNILHRFVEKTVQDLFVGSFQTEAEKQIPNWIGLAASREVMVSLNTKKISKVLPDTFGNSIYSKDYMFGTTPINEAFDIVSMRLLNHTYKRRDKILVIISDGEFVPDFPLQLADLLKQAGILIICCCVTDSDIITKLISKHPKTWPTGAKTLFEMASIIDNQHQLAQIALNNNIPLPEGKKWFYQVNQSETMKDVIDIILPDWQYSDA